MEFANIEASESRKSMRALANIVEVQAEKDFEQMMGFQR
jgi:hypothetical protein